MLHMAFLLSIIYSVLFIILFTKTLVFSSPLGLVIHQNLLVLISLYMLQASIYGPFTWHPCHFHIFLSFHIILHIMARITFRNHCFTLLLLYSNISHWKPYSFPCTHRMYLLSWSHLLCSQNKSFFSSLKILSAPSNSSSISRTWN